MARAYTKNSSESLFIWSEELTLLRMLFISSTVIDQLSFLQPLFHTNMTS